MSSIKMLSQREVSSDAEEHGALTQLRALLAQRDSNIGERLPPERTLCDMLGVTRNGLRKALATLENEGQIWRHVGRGTFIGPRMHTGADETKRIAGQTSPADVMEARLAIEPQLARLAALHATGNDLKQMQMCIDNCKAATDWRVYETWDNRFHRAIAEATRNVLLLSLFDTLNTVRRTVVWGRLRAGRPYPGLTHHSHQEHDAVMHAIQERDIDVAEECIRAHLEHVRKNLLNSGESQSSASV